MHIATKLLKYWFWVKQNVSAGCHLLIFAHVLFIIISHADKSLEMDQALALSWHLNFLFWDGQVSKTNVKIPANQLYFFYFQQEETLSP